MNLPSFVLPYQRSLSRWYTFVLVFTQTIPFSGGTRASVVLGLAVSLFLPADGAFGLSAATAGASVAFAAAGAAAPTETSGVILSIVFLETPALERSFTDWYGRPATIFLAVAAPTPGSFSSSAWVAELRSILAPVEAPLVVCAHPAVGPSQLPASNTAMLSARMCDMIGPP